MSEPVHADVLYSFLDYRAVYREPIFDFLKLHGQIHLAVFRALREWNVSLENITSKQNPANLNEVSATFTLPGGRIGFTVSLGMITLFVANPSWSEAGMIGKMAEAGVKAVVEATGLVVDQQKASIAMHLKPASGSIKDAVSGFLRPAADEVQGDNVRAYGFSVYRKDSAWTIDASALYRDALFVRIDRLADSKVPLETLAAQLNSDETRILDLLRLKVD